MEGLTRFMEKHGTFRYCACMRWRMRSAQFSRSTKEDRADALLRLALDLSGRGLPRRNPARSGPHSDELLP